MNNATIINGIEVYTKGNYQNKPLLFIHGNSLDAKIFIKQFEAINTVPLIAISLPGHGNSCRPIEYVNTYSLPGYTEVIKQLISELKINELILVGHSLGGHIAIECLELLKEVKGVFIFGTPPISMPPDLEKMYLPNPLLNYLFKPDISPNESKELAEALVHNNSALANNISEYILNTSPFVRQNLFESISKGEFKNEMEVISNTQVPIAIAHGIADSIVNKNYFSQINSDKLWEKKIQYIPNAGHCPQLENPLMLNLLLENFYNSVFN